MFPFVDYLRLLYISDILQDGEEANADASVKGDQPNENERVSDAAPLMHNKEQGVDLFNSEATDPVKSKAMSKCPH